MKLSFLLLVLIVMMSGVVVAGNQIIDCNEFQTTNNLKETLVLDQSNANPLLSNDASSSKSYTGCTLESDYSHILLEGVDIKTSSGSKDYTLTFPQDTTGLYQVFSVSFPKGTTILFENKPANNLNGPLVTIPDNGQVSITTINSEFKENDQGILVISAKKEGGSFALKYLVNPSYENNLDSSNGINYFPDLSLYDESLTVRSENVYVYALVNSYLFLFRDVGSGDVVQMEDETLLFQSNIQESCTEKENELLSIHYQLEISGEFENNYLITGLADKFTCNTQLSLPSKNQKVSLNNHKIVSGKDDFEFTFDIIDRDPETSDPSYAFLLNTNDVLTFSDLDDYEKDALPSDVGTPLLSGNLVLAFDESSTTNGKNSKKPRPVQICGQEQYSSSGAGSMTYSSADTPSGEGYAFGEGTTFDFYLVENEDQASCYMNTCQYNGIKEDRGDYTPLWCGSSYPRWNVYDIGYGQEFSYLSGEWSCLDGSSPECFGAGPLTVQLYPEKSPLLRWDYDMSSFDRLAVEYRNWDVDSTVIQSIDYSPTLYAKQFSVGSQVRSESSRYVFKPSNEKAEFDKGSLVMTFHDDVVMQDTQKGKSYRFDTNDIGSAQFDFRLDFDSSIIDSSLVQPTWSAFSCCGKESFQDIAFDSKSGALQLSSGCTSAKNKGLSALSSSLFSYTYIGECQTKGSDSEGKDIPKQTIDAQGTATVEDSSSVVTAISDPQVGTAAVDDVIEAQPVSSSSSVVTSCYLEKDTDTDRIKDIWKCQCGIREKLDPNSKIVTVDDAGGLWSARECSGSKWGCTTDTNLCNKKPKDRAFYCCSDAAGSGKTYAWRSSDPSESEFYTQFTWDGSAWGPFLEESSSNFGTVSTRGITLEASEEDDVDYDMGESTYGYSNDQEKIKEVAVTETSTSTGSDTVSYSNRGGFTTYLDAPGVDDLYRSVTCQKPSRDESCTVGLPSEFRDNCVIFTNYGGYKVCSNDNDGVYIEAYSGYYVNIGEGSYLEKQGEVLTELYASAQSIESRNVPSESCAPNSVPGAKDQSFIFCTDASGQKVFGLLDTNDIDTGELTVSEFKLYSTLSSSAAPSQEEEQSFWNWLIQYTPKE